MSSITSFHVRPFLPWKADGTITKQVSAYHECGICRIYDKAVLREHLERIDKL